MIEFDKLQWTEEPPRATKVNTTHMGMRIRVYNPEKRGQPHARIFVTDPIVVEQLRNQPVRFLTAYSDAHGTRAMAFELCSASSYAFKRAPKGSSVSVAFGLFSWMNPDVAAYPIRQWAWDGRRLIVLLPAGVQKDVAFDPEQITHAENVFIAPPVKPVEIAFKPDTHPVSSTPTEAARALAGYAAADDYPANPTTEQLESAIARGAASYAELATPPPVVETRTPEPPASPPVALHALDALVQTHTRDKPAKPPKRAPLEPPRTFDEWSPEQRATSKELASVVERVRRPKNHTPVVPRPRAARPETPATRLQAQCKFLQLDADLRAEVEGCTLVTTRGSLYCAPDAARVVGLLIRNVESGYGATGLSELHNARFRAGDPNKSLTSLADTEAWLDSFSTLLSKVGAVLRVADRLYALDAV